MNEKGRREVVVFVDYFEMPENIKKIVRNWHNSGPDRILEYVSDMYPAQNQTWQYSLTSENLRRYYENQREVVKYSGDYAGFIVEYGLEFDVWLLESEVDLGTRCLLVNIGSDF